MVADQLRISQGWVRCGMCQSVFDASEDLQTVSDDLLQSAMEQTQTDEAVKPAELVEPERADAPDSEAADADLKSAESQFDDESVAPAVHESDAVSPPVTEVEAAPEAELVPESASVPEPVESVAGDASAETPAHAESTEPSFIDQARPLVAEAEVQAASSAAVVDEVSEELPQAESSAEDAAVGKAAAEPAAAEPGITDSEPQEIGDVEIVSDQHLLSTDVDAVRSEVNAAQPVDEESAELHEPLPVADEPCFVRQARRQAFWQSTGVRVALVLGSVVAAGGLLAQHAWQQRDTLAAEYPALAPALTKACKAVGCELQPRREIADVVISGSGFKQLADAHEYQWSLTLENRSDAPVATPVAELTLTDAQDKPLLRRVVDLKPLGAPEQLQPRQEWSVNVPVQVQELSAPVAGYRALVFYP